MISNRWAAGLVLLAGTLAAAPARADVGDFGYVGVSMSGVYTDPSGSKPESKLWFNDGRWWGSLWDSVSQDFHIFRLDIATQTWIDTKVTLDTRYNSRSDVLWDGSHLYVASYIFSLSPASGYPAKLYRFSYDAANKTYTLDSGFPVTIHDYRVETVVIDKDSTGTLWATWARSNQIYVSHTLNGDDRTWGAPFVLPFATGLTSDDISSVIAFGGNRIGVMWSNQNDQTMHWAFHRDGETDTSWTGETAAQGSLVADDHINLKTDASGNVYAAVKTSKTTSTSPLVNLLVRNAVSGGWSSYVFGTVADDHTRPIVEIDEEQRTIHVFATAPVDGGTIYEKTASMDAIAFEPGLGRPVIRDASSLYINNVTSTKQNVDGSTGLVVVASNNSTKRYWHAYDPIVAIAPVADFSATPVAGLAPLAVTFSDASTGMPTSWAWDFGDGSTSSERNPSHLYMAPGLYSVSLTVTNSAGDSTKTAPDLINVTPVGLTLAFAPVADAQVSSKYPTTNYGTLSSLRVRYSGSDKYRTYLQFAVAGLTAPVGAAKLRLYVTNPGPDGGGLYVVPDNTWTESTINWNNKPALASAATAKVGAATTGTWVELDVSSVVTGDGLYAFSLKNASSDSVIYDSREGTNPPQLVITQLP